MEMLRHGSTILLLIIFTSLKSFASPGFQPQYLPEGLRIEIATNASARSSFATDFGNLSTCSPAAVFYPSSPHDIAALVRFSYTSRRPFPIAIWGRGHSQNGQTFNPFGVLIDMPSLGRNRHANSRINVTDVGPVPYVDAGGEQIWADVLSATIEYGLTPRVFTDYTGLSVGGTLSNAGISGAAFKHGPQISNVYELDVITGTGETVTCSRKKEPGLFYAALGRLGQFGVITRARIALEPAKQMVRWIQLIYTDVELLLRDQETLISPESGFFDFTKAQVLLNDEQVSEIQSPYFSDSEIDKITRLADEHKGSTYLLVLNAYYDNTSVSLVNEKQKQIMEDLRYVSGFSYSGDETYVDSVNQLYDEVLALKATGAGLSHPWLVLLLPKSKVLEFDSRVIKGLLKDTTADGSVVLLPMNRTNWDDKMSAVTPDDDQEEIFYQASFLWTVSSNNRDSLEHINSEILNICGRYNLGCKEYLPHFTNQLDWQKQFGKKWGRFVARKRKYDPKGLLSPGQQIFAPLVC